MPPHCAQARAPPSTLSFSPAPQQACIAKCSGPPSAFAAALGEASEAFQSRIQRCHQVAGEAAGAAAEHERLDVYVSRLRPCFAEESGKLGSLFAGAKAVLEGGGAGGAVAKKGWF